MLKTTIYVTRLCSKCIRCYFPFSPCFIIFLPQSYYLWRTAFGHITRILSCELVSPKRKVLTEHQRRERYISFKFLAFFAHRYDWSKEFISSSLTFSRKFRAPYWIIYHTAPITRGHIQLIFIKFTFIERKLES